MRAHTALSVYVSLVVASAARGDTNWNTIHDQALQAYQKGHLETAEPLFRKSAELAGRPAEVGASANDLGVVLHMRGLDVEARQWLTRSLSEWQRAGSINEAALTAHSLASVERALGDYADADRTLRAALETRPDNRETVAMLNNLLGDLLREQGYLTEARESALATLKIGELPWHLRVEASMIAADVDRDTGHLQASIAAWANMLTEARLRNEAIIEAVALRGLGEAHVVGGDLATAEPLLRKALTMFEATNSLRQVASTLTDLGELYLSEMKPAMAESALRRAVQLVEQVTGPAHPQLAVLLQMRADAASRQGASQRARADLDRAGEIMNHTFGGRSTVMGAFLVNRGIIEERAGDRGGAADTYEQAAGILRTAGPEARDLKTTLMNHYANVLKMLHRKDQAKAVLAEAKSFRH